MVPEAALQNVKLHSHKISFPLPINTQYIYLLCSLQITVSEVMSVFVDPKWKK